jgi:8-oxo-dGTP pyrophosphatase MutT (NUDIX family)
VRYSDVVSRLGGRLPEALPEPPAELLPVLTTGEWRRPPDDPDQGRPAAVLVLITPDHHGEARMVLIERVDRGGHHGGEVSFPGGSAEPGDADPVATALREAAEEIGLDAAAVGLRVVGSLPPFWIPVSDYRVTPVVAIADRRPDVYVAQEREVVRVLEPPLATFLPGAEIRIVEREVRGWSLRYGAYPVEDLLVWGATARILGQLGRLLGEADEPPSAP